MSDPMAEIRASFFIECEELLEALQDGLQAIDDGVSDEETVNMVFRSVHSIKGGAGAFGLDTLVGFAHTFETALDEVRAGRLVPEGDTLKLFFHSSDILGDLVRECRDGHAHADEVYGPVLSKLESVARVDDISLAPETGIVFQPAPLAIDLNLEMGEDSEPVETVPAEFLADGFDLAEVDVGAEQPGEPSSQVHFKPDPVLYAHGSEPLFLFRALRDLGPIDVRCHDNDLPGLDAMDAEQSYIGWTLTLHSGDPEETIREVFEFVEGLCVLDIEAHGSPADAPIGIGPADLAQLGDNFDIAQKVNPPSRMPVAEPEMETALPAGHAGPPMPQTPQTEPKAEPEPPRARTAPAMPRATVRVDLERIDRLVNLVGEIVINQAMLAQSVEAAALPPSSPIRTGLDEFLQLTRDIQESVMMIRAQPVKSLFQRMSRIVREASGDLGKEVRLKIEGENTEVDKTVIERLADPLTHMIRNAVDHGLEPGDARVAAGKPREGHIALSAKHRSGRIVIEISDDGAGIDRTQVMNKAIDNGLITKDAQLTDAEIDALLFAPGLSTAESVSNLSGRGVGMDVVRSAIQALGGRISISSERGQGSTFSISLPLTLAVLDGMVVRVADETLIVPLNTILETLALTDDEICALGPDTYVIKNRGQFLPLLDLGAELGYRAPLASYAGGVVLLIGQEDGPAAAIAVDTIEDQRQVVIKGLQDSYGRVPGIAAATILGDGQIALIVDPIDLVSSARGGTRHPRAPAAMTIETHHAKEARA